MKQRLAALTGRTYNEVLDGYLYGTIPQSTFDAFMAVWDWSAIRHTGMAGMKQEAFYARFGAEAYYRRINRVRVAFGFKPYAL